MISFLGSDFSMSQTLVQFWKLDPLLFLRYLFPLHFVDQDLFQKLKYQFEEEVFKKKKMKEKKEKRKERKKKPSVFSIIPKFKLRLSVTISDG